MMIENLKNKLYPHLYSRIDEIDSEVIILAMSHRRGLLARYVLVVCEDDGQMDGKQYLEFVRNEVKKQYRALWIFAEVGLHIIIKTTEENANKLKNLEADLTGLHAVIIQGIHVIQSSRDGALVSISQWGSIRFGYGDEIDSLIKSL